MSALPYDPMDPKLADVRPAKKPRGRPFQRGVDPRRQPGGPHGVTGAQPAPAPLPAPSGTLENAIAEIARHAAQGSVNEDRVRAIVAESLQHIEAAWDETTTESLQVIKDELREEMANLSGARDIVVTLNAEPPRKLAGVAHAALKRVLTLAAARMNVLLVGPAGCGKTHLCSQVADALARMFGDVSCAPGLPESVFVGRMVPNLSNGTENYRETPFVRAYREGGVFLVDEVDNADASTLLVLNSALANGHMTLPNGERVARHPDFVLIASANTYGNGQSREYVGRTQLDAAFLDRFVGATVTLDYDDGMERAVCPETEIRDAVQAIRSKARALKLRRVVSTRGMLAVRTLVTQCGDSLPNALLALTEGWTPEDRKACGVVLA